MVDLIQHTVSTPYMVGPVHFYSGVISGELVLFDTGPPTEQTQRYLQANVDLEKLQHVFITHCHIDHYGQASWLEKEFGATIYVPYRDYLKLTEHDSRMQQMYFLLSDLGFDAESLAELKKIFESGSLFPPFPQKYLAVESNIPKHLGIDVLQCPGHSQSDVVYATADWAVTGDTMLKGVFQSPLLDIDLETGERFNNYRAYCETLIRLSSLENRRIYPGHRKGIHTTREVLHFYIAKLLSRAKQVVPYQREENLMVLLDQVLEGRNLDVFHIYLKASEIVFMKDFLAEPELLESSLREIDLFASVEEQFDTVVQG